MIFKAGGTAVVVEVKLMATFSWLRLILGTTTTVYYPVHLKRPETRCRLWFVSLCGDCVYGTMFTAPSHNPFRTNSGEHHKLPLTLPQSTSPTPIKARSQGASGTWAEMKSGSWNAALHAI